jgi:hypothetical protein
MSKQKLDVRSDTKQASPSADHSHPDWRESYRTRKTMMRTLARESDRGAILVATAVVDECLAEALTAWLAGLGRNTPKRRKSVETLLQPQGPLGSLWSRAQMALGADLIEEWAFDAIDCLRKLRNECAHRHCAISFADLHVRDVVKRMAGLVATGIPNDDGPRRISRRKRVMPELRDWQGRRTISLKHAATLVTFAYAGSALIGYLDATVGQFRHQSPQTSLPPS